MDPRRRGSSETSRLSVLPGALVASLSGLDLASPSPYLVFLGSAVLVGLYLFVLKRWTASGASYQFLPMPVVARCCWEPGWPGSR